MFRVVRVSEDDNSTLKKVLDLSSGPDTKLKHRDNDRSSYFILTGEIRGFPESLLTGTSAFYLVTDALVPFLTLYSFKYRSSYLCFNMLCSTSM